MRLRGPTSPVEPGRSGRAGVAARSPEIAPRGGDQHDRRVHQPVLNAVARPHLTVEPHAATVFRQQPLRPVRGLALVVQPLVGGPSGGHVIQPDGLLPQSGNPQCAIGRLQQIDDPVARNRHIGRVVNCPDPLIRTLPAGRILRSTAIRAQGAVSTNPQRPVCGLQNGGIDVGRAEIAQAEMRPGRPVEPADAKTVLLGYHPDASIPRLENARIHPGPRLVLDVQAIC